MGLVALVLVGIAGWATINFDRIVNGAKQDADASQPVRTRSVEREQDGATASRHSRIRAGKSSATPLAELLGRNNGFSNPTPEEVAAYLAARGRSAANLVAAYQCTRELALLREAVAKDPGNARALLLLVENEETPEAKQAALAAFRQHHPDNAMGDYLLAAAELTAGRIPEASQALAAAAAKTQFDRGGDGSRELEAIHRFVGTPPVVSRAMGKFSAAYSASLARLGRQIRDGRDQATAAGDSKTAMELTRSGLTFAARIRSGGSMLDSLVAGGAEGILLKDLPPDLVLEPGTPSVGDRMAAIQAGRDEILELSETTTKSLSQLNERDTNAYFNLVELEGELAAARWLRQRESAPTQER